MSSIKIEFNLDENIIDKFKALKILNKKYKDFDFDKFFLNYLDNFINEEIIKSISEKKIFSMNKTEEIEEKHDFLPDSNDNYSYAQSIEDDSDLSFNSENHNTFSENKKNESYSLDKTKKQIDFDELVSSNSIGRYKNQKSKVKVSNLK